MPRPVLLLTGTSTGIGRATAIEAARSGWTVVATVRDISNADGLRAAADEARRCGSAARVTRTMPMTLMSRTRAHSSSELSATVPCAPTPALLTTMSS